MNRLAVIILNWNGKNETISCIDSIHKTQEGEFDVIVVDNGSLDGSADSISLRYPMIRMIRSSENLGFAEGMNIGINGSMELGYSKLLLFNNDTEFIQPGVLKAYDTVLEGCPEAGAVSATIVLDRKGSILQKELVADASLFKTIFYKIFCPPYPLRLGNREFRVNGIRCKSVPMIHGVALGFKASVLRKVGKFNRDFFCYEEDRDLLIRIRKAGYQLLTLPEYRIFHHWSSSTEQMSEFKMYYKSRNLWYMRNRYSSKRYVAYAFARLFGVAARNRLISYFVRGLRDALGGIRGNSFSPNPHHP